MTEVTNPNVAEALGINLKLFIAQLINFGVILYVVARWVYKPLLKAMDTREKKIADGLENAEKAKRNLSEVEQKTEMMLMEARKTSQQIIAETRTEAEEERKKLTAETQAELERQLQEVRERLKADKQAMMNTIKNEVADLVAVATQKVVAGALDEEAHRKLIQGAISDLEGAGK